MSVAVAPRRETPWLFSPTVDVAAFLGSAAVTLAILAWGARQGLLQQGETPPWAWISLILMVDVAHVYATGFRVYFDREELRRRPWLYAGVPLACFVMAMAVYSEEVLLFWRMVAYLAVFHFVRQQYGWVMLYRAKGQETGRWSRVIDTAAIYLATIYPLAYWHASLPRQFSWFVDRDFVPIPSWTLAPLLVLYVASLGAYAVKAAACAVRGRANPGKDIVVFTTAACWYVGIVACNSDFAFTVTNVVIHGVPYIVLVWWYVATRRAAAVGSGQDDSPPGWTRWKVLVMMLSTIWLLAYVEELFWDRSTWHEREWLFGAGDEALSDWSGVIVPLLAVPQLTHYVLDGFIWKRRSNPQLGQLLASARGAKGHVASETESVT